MGQLSVDLSAKMELLKTEEPQKTKTGISFPRYFTAKLEAGKTPYDDVRLNSAVGYITPKDMLAGRQQEIHQERDRKLETARKQR